MRSFSQFLKSKSDFSLAESLVISGIDSEFFCESVIRNARKVNPRSSHAADQIAEAVYSEIWGGLGSLFGAGKDRFVKDVQQKYQGAKDLASSAYQGAANLAGKAVQGVKDVAGAVGTELKNRATAIGDIYMQGEGKAQLQSVMGDIANMKKKLETIFSKTGAGSENFAKNINLQLDSLTKKLNDMLTQLSQDRTLRVTSGGLQPAR